MKDKRKIFAEDLIEALRDDPSINGANFRKLKQHIEEVPDAVEVVHGRWIGVDSSYWRWYHDGARAVERITYRCSECARKSIIKTNYCPNCGAKMDGDGNA